MINLHLELSDIIKVLEASKALKISGTVIWYNNMILHGESDNHIAISFLNTDHGAFPLRGIALNHRQLSAFSKNLISLNNDLQFAEFGTDIKQIQNEKQDNLALQMSNFIDRKVAHDISMHRLLDTNMYGLPEDDVSKEFDTLYHAVKADGSIQCIHNGYIMYIWPAIIPLHKADKIYLTILDNHQGTFTSRFRIVKKSKAQVLIYLSFLHLK